jgi:hypothetical protein
VPAKPDGKQRNERITFTRPAAERIAKVVRQVEGGDRDSSGLTFRRVPPQGEGRVFRIATFTGAWSIGATKAVTFKYQTATPNTVVATNLFFSFPAPAAATDCSIAKDGTAWFLVDVPFETATAVFAGNVVTSVSTINFLSGISVAASLNTSNCQITLSTTQTTSSATVVTGVSSDTFTATFLRFKVS